MNSEKEIKELKEEILRLKKVITVLQNNIKLLDGKIARSNLLIRENKTKIDQITRR